MIREGVQILYGLYVHPHFITTHAANLFDFICQYLLFSFLIYFYSEIFFMRAGTIKGFCYTFSWTGIFHMYFLYLWLFTLKQYMYYLLSIPEGHSWERLFLHPLAHHAAQSLTHTLLVHHTYKIKEKGIFNVYYMYVFNYQKKKKQNKQKSIRMYFKNLKIENLKKI